MPYHDIPGITKDSHRQETALRVKTILDHVDIKNKRVVDFGCSVGGISLGLAQAGAELVTGIDYDKETIAFAREAAHKLKVNNVIFKVDNINPAFLGRLENYDVAVWLSHWMWFAKQYGLPVAQQMIWSIAAQTPVLVFESAADDIKKGKIAGATQADIARWLEEFTPYQDIKNLGKVGTWKNRHVFICKDPQTKWRGYTSLIERRSPRVVRKTARPGFEHTIKTEQEALRRLSDSDIAPDLINAGPKHLDITYAGRPVREGQSIAKQHANILQTLRAKGIEHRDIQPRNFLELDGKLKLIDFGWARFDGDQSTTNDPGDTKINPRFSPSEGWDDEYSLRKTIERLQGQE